VRNVPQPDAPGIVVEVVGLDAMQTPLVLGFSALQRFTSWRHALRASACVFRQARFAGFVPVQSRLLGMRARQPAILGLQSFRQWLGLAATPPASISVTPIDTAARAGRNFVSALRARIMTGRLLHACQCVK
jgi:hypothetical protein